MKKVFSKNGLLAKHIEGYAPRQEQLDMATLIETTLKNSSVLVAEAGTGTGKTFAYLAPAILSNQTVFISTGTKNLQDQLFYNDLPALRKALDTPFRSALLKGRSNYLCHYRLEMAHNDQLNKHQQAQLQALSEWSELSKSGDLSESDLIDTDSPLWPKVTSTVDNCLGQDCPNYSECFVAEARKKAQESDIVVINHHLLMSDMALKASNQGEILPSADAYIIDEAHQLPEIATQFLGNRISSHQIIELCRDSIREMEDSAPDMNTIRDNANKIEASLHSFRVIIGEKEERTPWLSLRDKLGVKTKLTSLISTIENLSELLEIAAPRSKGLDQCFARSGQLLDTLMYFDQHDDTDQTMILWADIRRSSFILHATPHNVNQYFQKWMDEKSTAWIFTSATLTVEGSFNNFSHHLGLDTPETALWPSPFDYQKQSLLYMPHIPVAPNHHDYNNYISDIAKQVITHSKGRTFILFTSFRSMHAVAELLENNDELSDYPLMIQGSASKSSLLNKFKRHGNAVLLGTNSFWEGVDVRGQALSCVIIDKIPFASPGDPILQARIDTLRERGGNPFATIQIPAAVIQLKQGIGRLIRDPQDTGVLVLCDPRFLSKSYGKLFLRSLPPMPISQDINDVAQFFANKDKKLNFQDKQVPS